MHFVKRYLSLLLIFKSRLVMYNITDHHGTLSLGTPISSLEIHQAPKILKKTGKVNRT